VSLFLLLGAQVPFKLIQVTLKSLYIYLTGNQERGFKRTGLEVPKIYFFVSNDG